MSGSSNRENPPPPKRGRIPPPGSLPKLPQSIFILDKKGGTVRGGEKRRSEQK
jgi:hypothetical protein